MCNVFDLITANMVAAGTTTYSHDFEHGETLLLRYQRVSEQ
jgi:hypothetical protein